MKRCLRTIRNILGTFVMIAVVFGIGYVVGKYYHGDAETFIQSWKNGFDLQLPGETEKTVVTVDEVEAKILEIGELTSCEGEYIVTRGRDFTRYMLDDIPVPGTTNHVELTCTGVVKAGYDLEEITVRVDTESKKIYVSLPEAQINSNQLIWDSMVCKEENNILNPINFAKYQMLITEIKEEGLQKAKDDGIFDAVEKNARNLITNFLGCFVEYQVVFL